MSTRRNFTGILVAIAAAGAFSLGSAGGAAADAVWNAQAQYDDGHTYNGTGPTQGAAEQNALENCRIDNSERPAGCHSTGYLYRDGYHPYRYHRCDSDSNYCEAQGGGHKGGSGGGGGTGHTSHGRG